MISRGGIVVCGAVLAAVLLYGCANPGGGGTEWEAKVTGYARYDESGVPVAGARVVCCSERYLRDMDGQRDTASIRETTTDGEGFFSIEGLYPGRFHVEVNDLQSQASLTTCDVSEDEAAVPLTCTLTPTGRIDGTVVLPEEQAAGEVVVRVYGLDRATRPESDGTFSLEDMPEGTYSLRIVPVDTVYSAKEVDAVSVSSGGVLDLGTVPLSLNLGAWNYRHTIFLNTTASGADVAGTVTNFPVLIRLTSSNFDFGEAQSGGGDLRFINEDGTPLPYEIERWDPVAGLAELWVNIDTIRGNDSTQSITLYWGNPDAPGGSDGAAVFDTANGVAAVWHLGSDCNDASAGGHNALVCSASDTTGIIGSGKTFDGSDSILIPGLLGEPSSSTLSAWALLDSASADGGGEILSIGDAVLIRMDYSENNSGTGGAIHITDTLFNHIGSGQFLARTGWHFITFTYDESTFTSTLYIDGVRAGLITDPDVPIDYSGVGSDTYIGKHGNGKTKFNFSGLIDEVRVSALVRDTDWIRLCFMNQKELDALVRW